MTIDRISSLPDELLINILNILPTKYAVITSILSRKWGNLFKEVTHLDFDDSLLFNSLSVFDHEKRCVSFRAFVCKMLGCLKLANLISFRIRCTATCEGCERESVGLWLSAILSHGIQEIDLCICIGGTPDVFPHSLFTCKTLCILKLNFVFTILNIPGTVCLPCLKILHLQQVTVIDEDLIGRIFAGCPLLEFNWDSLTWYDARQLSISAPSLRKLKLGDGKYFESSVFVRGAMDSVAIIAPLLQSFYYSDKLAKSYFIKTSNYLVEAYVDIYIDSCDFKDSSLSHAARDLIQGVSNVKRLFLSADGIKAVTLVKDELPILRNLTTLKIGCSTNPHLTLLRLLGSAPNLEELTFSEGLFHVGLTDKDTVQQDNWGRGVVPSCLKTHLKVVEIEHFLGLKEELRIVEYFLSNGHALEELIVHKWMGRKAKFKVRKQLKRLGRRWNKCLTFC